MVIEAMAARLAALGDPTRLRILQVLRGGERCVCELRTSVDVPPNLLSYHLKVLRDAGVVEGTRRGRWVDYRLVPAALDEIRRVLTGEGDDAE